MNSQVEGTRALSGAAYVALVEGSPEPTLVVDDEGRIILASDATTELLARPAKWLTGQPILGLVHPDDRAGITALLTPAPAEPGAGHGRAEARLSHLHGTWIDTEVTATDLLDHPDVAGVLLGVHDLRAAKHWEDELRRLALHDELTGLANRTLFHDHVDHALAHLCRSPVLHAVVFIDVDGFKRINDSLGHAAGDEVLVTIAERLRSRLRPSDIGARLGGDEFAVLVENTSRPDAAALAQRLLDALCLPLLVQGKGLVLTASAGLAFSDQAADAEALLRNADVAMYRAKAKGKSRCEAFRPAMHEAAVSRLSLETDLRRAVDDRHLVLHYQPIVDLSSGGMVAVEALARWPRPGLEMLSPSRFVPLAEESELILPLGRAVLEQACRQARRWADAFPGEPTLAVAVNVSVRQLEDDRFVGDVVEALTRSGLPAAALSLEITESVFMADVPASIAKIAQLKALGVSVAIDDFGTGYSSLSLLRALPIDTLKIDKSFVDGVCLGPEESAVARAVIDLARTFGLRTIAEGIEDSAQLSELTGLGADMGQGYLLSRPLDAEAMGTLLEGGRVVPRRRAQAGRQCRR